MVLIEFAMAPRGVGKSLSAHVARILDVIDRSGLAYQLTPMGTILEGEWDEAMGVVNACFKALEKDFTLTEEPDAAGQQWVKAVPKSRDGQLQSIRVGFKPGAKGAELGTLDILDSFGQRSVLTFNNFEVNAAVPASHFQFTPPKGADVLRN